MNEKLPRNLTPVDPRSRFFPLSWKESYFRRHLNQGAKGYVCPACGGVFRGLQGFAALHSDHIHPYSEGGLTVWENLVLLCGRCNLLKSNKLR